MKNCTGIKLLTPRTFIILTITLFNIKLNKLYIYKKSLLASGEFKRMNYIRKIVRSIHFQHRNKSNYYLNKFSD